MAQSKAIAEYGATNPSHNQIKNMPVKRLASIIGLNPEKEQYYRELHANVWPSIVERIRKANIRNYSIYVAEIEGGKYLFSYCEYIGTDLEADMKAMADDPETQKWWKETDPCQIELPGRKPGAHWRDMEMVFLME
jgi:L-rhamnose mutarotase